MVFLIQFIVPLLAILTAVLIISSAKQVKLLKSHEEKESQRHSSISNSHTQLFKEVEKVNKKIDEDLIPSISAAFKKKPSNYRDISNEDIVQALKDIDYDNHFISKDGAFILVGIEDDEKTDFLDDNFKTYFFIQPNTESKDLLIESHSCEFGEFSEEIALTILSFNDYFKISGFSIERFNNRYVLKGQYLIDAPDGYFSPKTLDFAMSAMFTAHQELIQALHNLGTHLSYINPNTLISLQNKQETSKRAINSES
jgi:hypothetical protein